MAQAKYGKCTNKHGYTDKEGNDKECTKYQNKEVQKVLAGKEFICSECGSKLMPCKTPTKPWNKIAVGVAIVALLCGGGYAASSMFGGKKSKSKKFTSERVITGDTGVEQETIEIKPQRKNGQEQPTDDAAAVIESGSNLIDKVNAQAEAEAQAKVEAEKKAAEEAEAKEKTQGKDGGQTGTNTKHGTVNMGYGSYIGDLKNGKPHGYGKLTYRSSQKIFASKDYVASAGDTIEGEFRDGKPAGQVTWVTNGQVRTIKP